jgi:gliding motility-associated-like protein
VSELITPNGDGANDYWWIGNLFYVPNNRVTLFDRWGEVVFRMEKYENDFDALDLPSGVYYYVVQDLDLEKTLSGYVWIAR